MAEVERRRRRLRRTTSGQAPTPAPPPSRPVPGPPPSAQTGPVHDPDVEPSTGNGDDRETERGLRGLVGSGSSQVSLAAALRARDAARPDEAELAAAERDLVIVRRGWVPREDLPRNLR